MTLSHDGGCHAVVRCRFGGRRGGDRQCGQLGAQGDPQRYDFKGTQTEIELEKHEIHANSTDDFKVKASVDVLQSKLARRQVPLKALVYGPVEPAGGRARQADRYRLAVR